MNFDAETYETIENYLTGNLTGTPHSNFEKRLQTDKLLAEEVALHKAMYEHAEVKKALESDEARVFQGQLNNALAQHNRKNPRNNIHKLNWKPLAIAASISLLIGFFLFQNYNTTTQPLALYETYAKHETLALVSKSAEKHDFSEIASAFQQEDYKQTEDKLDIVLQELPQDHPHRFSLKLTQGICQLELDEVEAAQNIFQELAAKDHPDAPKADWYLILTYLKQGNTQLTTQLIDKALEAGHGYKAREMREMKAAL